MVKWAWQRERLTCRVFWFSILLLISGLRVKSGPKYSKYSIYKTYNNNIARWTDYKPVLQTCIRQLVTDLGIQ